TIYVMALAAGFEPEIARKMAIYAHAPDAVTELDAISNELKVMLLASKLNAPGKPQTDALKKSLQQAEQHRDVMYRGFHVLTGEQAEATRANRAGLILSLKPG